MPIDARIPLGAQVTPIESPFVALSQIATLQAQRAQGEERAAAAQAAAATRREKAQIDEALSAAYTQDPATGEFTIDESKFAHLPGATRYRLQQELEEDRSKALGYQKTKLEMEKQRREYLGSSLRTLGVLDDDPSAFHEWTQKAEKLGALPPALGARLRQVTDPAQIRTIREGFIAAAKDDEKKADKPAPLQDTPIRAILPDGTVYEGLAGYNPDPAVNAYVPVGSTTPFPPGTKFEKPPTPVDPNLAATREITAALAQQQLASGGLTAGQRATEINGLRNSWTRQIQPVLERRGAVAKVDAGLQALKVGNRNAATQIIVTAFNKLQDETSVVREGEYARSEQGQALMARIQGALGRITAGGSSLTDTDLQGLATEAKNVAQALESVSTSALADTRQAMEETLDDYKIPHSRVFGGSTIGRRERKNEGGGGAPTTPGAPGPTKAVKGANGWVIELP